MFSAYHGLVPRATKKSKERNQKIGQEGIKRNEPPVFYGILEMAQKWFQSKIAVGLSYSTPGLQTPRTIHPKKGVWRAQESKGHENSCNSSESPSIIAVAPRQC